MKELVPAMDEPQRRPLPWETQACSSEVFLCYILSFEDAFAFTSHLFVSFCRTRTVQVLLLWPSLFWA